MNAKSVMIAMSVASLALAALATPALAVSKNTRAAYEAKAEKVRPALRAGEKEAWIANCLATPPYNKTPR